MLKKASTHGASAPGKSKTARSKAAKAKSKDKATQRMGARKAASEAASKHTAVAAKPGGCPRRSHSRSLSPDDRPNPRFAYRDHSPGAGPRLPTKSLTLAEGKSRAQDAKIASSKRADEGAAAVKKHAAPDSPRESGFSKAYHSLFGSSSDEAEEEGAVTEPQEISNDLDELQERFKLLSRKAPRR
ncbi:Hypothetical protein PHPALM_13903 [Phytophthora palmivora]|uniref:ABC Superfamily n=1 Tax=Phytophthora palmivora TaxID=4796 RepID=A0A2P4XW51_9STRA|nr:Hypothetical protein PHPALM_13903 [Phytophthora palmivora]